MGNYREDKDLIDVLHNGLHADMGTLIDIITDNGKGRISLSNETKEELLAAASSTVIDSEVIRIDESAKFLIAQEIQGFGGNTIINLFRGGEGVLYKEIAIDVASHLGANYNDKQDISQIEGAILLKVVEKSMEKMSEEEKKQFFDGIDQVKAMMQKWDDVLGKDHTAEQLFEYVTREKENSLEITVLRAGKNWISDVGWSLRNRGLL